MCFAVYTSVCGGVYPLMQLPETFTADYGSLLIGFPCATADLQWVFDALSHLEFLPNDLVAMTMYLG